MKKLVIIVAAAVLLFAGGISIFGDTQASADKENNHIQTYQTDHSNENKASSLTNYTEYVTIDKQIENIKDYQAKVVANNPNKRIILFSDDNNVEQYKSIFIKDTNRLKIIELDNGQVFNNVIK